MLWRNCVCEIQVGRDARCGFLALRGVLEDGVRRRGQERK